MGSIVDENKIVYTGDGKQIGLKKWGSRGLDSESEDESEDESDSSDEEGEDNDDDDDDDDDDGMKTPAITGDGTTSVASTTGTESTAGYSSIASNINLRKDVEDDEPKQLYTILKSKDRGAVKGEVFGSANTYVLPGQEDDGVGDNEEDEEANEGVASSMLSKGSSQVATDSSKRKRGQDGDEDDEDDEDESGKKFKF